MFQYSLVPAKQQTGHARCRLISVSIRISMQGICKDVCTPARRTVSYLLPTFVPPKFAHNNNTCFPTHSINSNIGEVIRSALCVVRPV
jgi:hypothetical protein